MKRGAVLSLSAFLGCAAAQERAADHPYSARVEVDGTSAHYRFIVPADAYRSGARRDLGDLRVFNAAGEPVPYAFSPRALDKPPPAVQAGKLFPLYGDREKGIDSASMRVQRNARGSVVNVSIAEAKPSKSRVLLGYVVDAADIKQPKQALVLAWSVREGFTGHVHVEASDDLKAWRSAASAPILFLQHDGARLERNRVELADAKAKYFRLSFSGVPVEFALKEIRVELRSDKPEPAREWLALGGKEGKSRGELEFDTGGHFPVDRLRLALPQPNTVAEVQFLARQREDDAWRPVARNTVYRLGGGAEKSAEVRSPEVVVPPTSERYWLLRVEQRGGGFGSGEVKLEIGWLPHELVFAARGAAPFTFAYGSRSAKPGALPAATVVPRRPDGELAPAKLAALGPVSEARPPKVSIFSDPMRFLGEEGEAKKWLLWSALVGGVLILAWMALRLLREMGKA